VKAWKIPLEVALINYTINMSSKATGITPKKGNAIIVGIAKDVSVTMNLDFERLNQVFSEVFKGLFWFVVESNSKDSSISTLTKIKERNSNFDFISIQHDSKVENRVIDMAEARNRYLEEVFQNPKYASVEYVVVADLNNLNDALTLEGVLSCFSRQDWDVCTANQDGPYYDVWALRHEFWSPNDCWRAFDFYRSHLKFPEKALYLTVHSRMLKIDSNENWIKTESSFGGLAIYRKHVLEGARYSGTNNKGEITCEHVPLHSVIVDNGGLIYINPMLINTRITDHSLNSQQIARLKRLLNYIPKLFKRYYQE